MNNYREKIYKKYRSVHTIHLYGEENINDIKKRFSAWEYYFLKFLPLDKNVKILDLGCGNGGFVYWLQSIGYINASGVDISEEQVEKAKKLKIDNVFQGNVFNFLTDKKNEYDIIFARDLLEHFDKEEILNLLELIYKSLKNEGILIIQTPNAEGPFAGKYRYADFTHEISFTQSSIRQICLSIGFKNVDVYSQSPVIHGLKSFIRFILWKFIEFCLRIYLLSETGQRGGVLTQNLIAVVKK